MTRRPAHPHRRADGPDRGRRLAAAHRPDVRPAREEVLLRLGHDVAQARRPGDRRRRSGPDRRGAAQPRPPRRQPRPRRARAAAVGRRGGHDRARARSGSAVRPAGSSRGRPRRLEAPGRPAIEITATPCRHGPPLSHPIVGDVIGFALRWDGQEHGVLWISGDTVLYDGVREVADRLEVDTALLHLGGVQFPVSGPLRYTMTARRRGGAVRPHSPAHGDPDPLRGLEALPRRGATRSSASSRGAPEDVPQQRPLAADRRRGVRTLSPRGRSVWSA